MIMRLYYALIVSISILLLTPSIVTATGINPSDVNIDGKVDIFDYNNLFSYYGSTGDFSVNPSDINKDNKIDDADFSLLIQNFNNVSKPEPEITITEPTRVVKQYFNDDEYKMNAEITPWSLENLKLGGLRLFLVSTYDTFLCSSPDNMFALNSWIRIKESGNCKLRQISTYHPSSPTKISDDPLWRRDYYGAFTGHVVSSNTSATLYTINHGELLNNDYHLPVKPCNAAPDIGYGKLPCDPKYRSGSYNAFIGMSSFAFTIANYLSANHFVDQGPIVWPANGYVENINGIDMKATGFGILHPSSIIRDNYIYVYYRDTSLGNEADGRGAGLKVARARIDNGTIDPLSFKTFYQDEFKDSALPIGFNKSQIRNYFNKKGGRSSSLLANDIFLRNQTMDGSRRPVENTTIPKTFSFGVAKVKGTSLYLGVSNDLSLGVTLRTSRDLVHWSKPTVVLPTENYFNGGVDLSKDTLLYPRLMDPNGDSNTEIDPKDFYVVGVQIDKSPFDPNKEVGLVKSVRLKLLNVATN